MKLTPTFLNPPIVEFVLGAQFAPLVKLTSAHFGRFWDVIGNEWTNPRDDTLISDQFERFGPDSPGHGKWRIKLEPAPLINRMTLISKSTDRLLQVQPTRFHLNWRKTEDFKPSYKELIDEFEEMFNKFVEFCTNEGLGDVEVNQWEVAYVDCFPKGQYWSEPEDWGRFLPGLFRIDSLPVGEQLKLEKRAAEWSFEIKPQLGRLHLSASLGRWKGGEPDALMLNLTARGPLTSGHTNTLREGLDLGHKIAVEQFLLLVDQKTILGWGIKE